MVENKVSRDIPNSIKKNLGNRKGMEHTGGVALDSEKEGGEAHQTSEVTVESPSYLSQEPSKR